MIRVFPCSSVSKSVFQPKCQVASAIRGALTQEAQVPKGPLIGEGRIAEVYAWGEGQALKLFRDWCAPDWVDYEARIARALCAQAGAASGHLRPMASPRHGAPGSAH